VSKEPVRFECQRCGACCKKENIVITLNGRDIVRIAQGLNLGPEAVLKVVDFLILADGLKRPEGLTGIPALETERGPAFLALRKMKNGRCVFLEDNLCMIHAVRPSVCRSFPFVFRKDSDGTYWGLSAQKDICPGIGEGPIVDPSELSTLAETILVDNDLYVEFAKEWNRGEATPTAERLIRAILTDTRFTA
jgi:hypothetical protein